MKLYVVHLTLFLFLVTVSVELLSANHGHHKNHKNTDKHNSHTTHAAHVHGEANLFVAQDGNKVQIEFVSPAFNIIGFEYMPKTKEEKQKLANALVQFENSADLFNLKSGDCLLSTSKIDNPFSGESAKKTGHRDFRVSYEYECKNIDNFTKMNANFLSNFHGIEKFIVQWVVNNKQASVTLTDKKSLIEF